MVVSGKWICQLQWHYCLWPLQQKSLLARESILAYRESPPEDHKQKSHYLFPSTLSCCEFPLCHKKEIMVWETGKVRLGSWGARRREMSSRRHKGRRCKGLSHVPGKLGMTMEGFLCSLMCLCSFPGICADLAKSCNLINGVICRDNFFLYILLSGSWDTVYFWSCVDLIH